MVLKDKAINFIYKIATSSRKVRNLLTPIGAIIGLMGVL